MMIGIIMMSVHLYNMYNTFDYIEKVNFTEISSHVQKYSLTYSYHFVVQKNHEQKHRCNFLSKSCI
jgi:hypothetical protein